MWGGGILGVPKLFRPRGGGQGLPVLLLAPRADALVKKGNGYTWLACYEGEWGSHLLCTGLGPKHGAAPSSPLLSPPLQSSCAQRRELGRKPKNTLPEQRTQENSASFRFLWTKRLRARGLPWECCEDTSTGQPGTWPKWAGGKLISQAIPSKLFWKQTNKTTRRKQGHAPRVST